ncbi:MAG: hypothetical protein COA36_03460 [Desulfotalea sp.]|nr:MAG: hypothetical protein COA36_03460 [Desulfotalea sp.]
MSNDTILSHLQDFFPLDNYSSGNIPHLVDIDKLDTSKQSLANILKGALLDETILEVQINNLETVYFCRVLDNPFEETLAEDGVTNNLKDPDYETGSYLNNHEYLFLTPLEPSQGNYLISASEGNNSKLILKIISSGTAIEIGCYFEGRTTINDIPALKVSFPLVSKNSKQAREFRAKVPKAMKFMVTIERTKKKPIITTPLNISLNGMSLLDPMGRKSNIQVDEKVFCSIQIPRAKPLLIEASIMHATNLRDSNGIQYCFGIKFIFSNLSAKSEIEKIVGLVQRTHLRELADLEEQFGVYYDK